MGGAATLDMGCDLHQAEAKKSDDCAFRLSRHLHRPNKCYG